MWQKPEKWEVVCKVCFSGFEMDDVEVDQVIAGLLEFQPPLHTSAASAGVSVAR